MAPPAPRGLDRPPRGDPAPVLPRAPAEVAPQLVREVQPRARVQTPVGRLPGPPGCGPRRRPPSLSRRRIAIRSIRLRGRLPGRPQRRLRLRPLALLARPPLLALAHPPLQVLHVARAPLVVGPRHLLVLHPAPAHLAPPLPHRLPPLRHGAAP